MDYLVLRDHDGGTARLTTASSASHYGCPVLRIEAKDVDGDFGPGDLIGDIERPETITPAWRIVAAWALEPGRGAEELEAARRYLAQIPAWELPPQVRARLDIEEASCT